MAVAVSIVTYNSGGVIADCLRSLPMDVKIYVADNCSRDNTLEVVRRERPDAVITVPRRNLGFGRGHNLNFRKTREDHVLVLNPDTVLRADCLDSLLQVSKDYPEAGMIGALHESDDGHLSLCFRNDFDYYPQLAKAEKDYNRKAAGATTVPAGPVCVEQITGALMLLSRHALHTIKGFNRRLFMYFEDDDICARMRRSGYNIILAPDARVIHREGQSSGRSYRVQRIKGYHFERSRKIVHAAYHGRGAAYYGLIAKGLVRCLRRAFKCILKGDHLRAVYYLSGCAGLLS